MVPDYTFSAPAIRPEYGTPILRPEHGCGIWTRKKGPGRALLREKLLRNYPVKLTDEPPVAKIVSSIRYEGKPT